MTARAKNKSKIKYNILYNDIYKYYNSYCRKFLWMYYACCIEHSEVS